MGTGISSILLYNLPYSFNGLKEIAIAIWLLNAVLFSLFLLMSMRARLSLVCCVRGPYHTLLIRSPRRSARYCIYPTLLYAMLFHPVQSLFLGCFPMGFATIVNMMVFAAAERWEGR
jgi:tellurite resistance protein TehA-like permease